MKYKNNKIGEIMEKKKKKTKTQGKLERKVKMEKAREEFFEIYNSLPEGSFTLGRTFTGKIESNYYKSASTYTRLIIGVKWFISHCDLEKYHVRYAYYGDRCAFMQIFDVDNKCLCKYSIVKNDVIFWIDYSDGSEAEPIDSPFKTFYENNH